MKGSNSKTPKPAKWNCNFMPLCSAKEKKIHLISICEFQKSEQRNIKNWRTKNRSAMNTKTGEKREISLIMFHWYGECVQHKAEEKFNVLFLISFIFLTLASLAMLGKKSLMSFWGFGNYAKLSAVFPCYQQRNCIKLNYWKNRPRQLFECFKC